MELSSGFNEYRLSNGVRVGFWWEEESQNIWLVYMFPDEHDWRGGNLNFQMGETFIRSMGGVTAYVALIVRKVNAQLRVLFPELYGVVPVPVPADFPSTLVSAGPATVEIATKLSALRLVNNAFLE